MRRYLSAVCLKSKFVVIFRLLSNIFFKFEICFLFSSCSLQGAHVVRADALSIPFREAADAVISIAVLHHFSSFERRRQAIEEMLRVPS